MQMLTIADDLSGAAEAAGLLRESRNSVTLTLSHASMSADVEAVVVDLDVRDRPDAASARMREALEGADADVVLVKIDSQLRGPVAAMVQAVRDRGALVCPALPALARRVVDGVVDVAGMALRDTAAWSLEPTSAPVSVADAIGAGARLVDLETVRGDETGLRDALAEACAPGAVAIVDAKTDADVERIAVVAAGLPSPPAFVGSAALVAAAARALAPAEAVPAADGPVPAAAVVTVVGSAEPSAAAQLDELAAIGTVVMLDADELEREPARAAQAIREAARDARVLAIGITAPYGPRARSSTLSASLATAVASAVPDDADLVLTGGETARRVLDALGVRALVVDGAVLRDDGTPEYGAVRSRAATRTIVTRPGSFGGRDSLVAIAAALTTGAARGHSREDSACSHQ